MIKNIQGVFDPKVLQISKFCPFWTIGFIEMYCFAKFHDKMKDGSPFICNFVIFGVFWDQVWYTQKKTCPYMQKDTRNPIKLN